MDYFQLDDSPTHDMSYVFLEGEPEGTNMTSWRLSFGEAMGDLYPTDAKWHMSEEYSGVKLASLLGNVSNVLVVDRSIKEVLAATQVPMECLPFTLLDHRRRVASRDYFIINPIGTCDCLNTSKSEIVYSDDPPGEVVAVHKHVLDPRKLAAAPDIFRVKEEPEMIVISSRLGKQIQLLDPPVTNVYLIKLEQDQ